MTDQTTQPKTRTRFRDRPIRLKFVFVIIVLLLIAALVAYISQVLNANRELASTHEILQQRTTNTASILAHSVAIFGNTLIVSQEYNQLQEYADSLISADKARDISYIAVVDTDGKAVVHTDRRFLGGLFVASTADSDSVATADVMDLTHQAATVYVGIRGASK